MKRTSIRSVAEQRTVYVGSGFVVKTDPSLPKGVVQISTRDCCEEPKLIDVMTPYVVLSKHNPARNSR